MLKSAQIASSFTQGAVNVIKNRIFQVVAFVCVVAGVIYWLGRRSAIEKAKYDEVDTDKLPDGSDKMENITRQQANDAVLQCRYFFYTNGLQTFDPSRVKINFMLRLINLSDYELGVINNLYNNRYVPEGKDNLYSEIEDDWGFGELSSTKELLLSRLRKIGAGKKAK
jgi:hypothetical protein